MIDELHVTDVALIHDATLTPADGLTAITGETGAGKTALLAALKLVVGERADAGLIREGADGLEVEGRFFSADDPDGHVVRRTLAANGRGRVQVDGAMASVRELAEGVGASVDLCGQHEHQRLLDVSTHVTLLDAFAGEKGRVARDAYVDALVAAREASRELARVREASELAADQLDQARFVLDRIDEVAPEEGEYERLEAELPRAQNAESLLRAAEEARSALASEGGAEDAISAAIAALRAAATHDPELARRADTLEGSLLDVQDMASELRRYRDNVDIDPAELARMQERHSALRGLLRSYGPAMEDVFAAREEAARTLSLVEDGGRHLAAAERAVDAAEAALASAADELDAVRAEVAPRLAEGITQQMALLNMGSAEVVVSQERLPRAQWTKMGPSHVELLYRPGSGMTPRPLRKIASGGEVSRVMLAVKVVLGEADACDTLVFDEVDAGVGGATARSLATVIANLARTHQVIIVTHLAQVAVQAERHYVVSKTDGASPQTRLVEVTGEDRVREVARLLSGDTGDASLDHARELLVEAAGH